MLDCDKLLICGIVLFLGCDNSPNPMYEDSLPPEVWICHNPGSELHGELCQEEVDIVRGQHQPCYWDKNGSNYGRGERVAGSYCWLLEEDSCALPLEMAWQKNNCHFFERQ